MPVYFAEIQSNGFIKIGVSVDVKRRLKTLKSVWGSPLRLIATKDGDYPLEQAIHRHLWNIRERGIDEHLYCGGREVYRPHPIVLAFAKPGTNPERRLTPRERRELHRTRQDWWRRDIDNHRALDGNGAFRCPACGEDGLFLACCWICRCVWCCSKCRQYIRSAPLRSYTDPPTGPIPDSMPRVSRAELERIAPQVAIPTTAYPPWWGRPMARSEGMVWP